jgi:hypothetical protein
MRLGKHARKMFDNADEAKCAIHIPALFPEDSDSDQTWIAS